MSAGRGGSISGELIGITKSTIGWLVVGCLLFGTAITAAFAMVLLAATGDAISIIVHGLPVLAEHIKGVVVAAPAVPKAAG